MLPLHHSALFHLLRFLYSASASHISSPSYWVCDAGGSLVGIRVALGVRLLSILQVYYTKDLTESQTTETAGFEPAEEHKPLKGLAIPRHKPLGHISKIAYFASADIC